jgi:4-hydroxy-tetrahydrodipicolinate synthase
MTDLKGINLAMQTPHKADGSIDYQRWVELVDTYLDAGVHGLVLGSGTGQHPYLTAAECDRLFELACPRIAGQANIICQTSALNMDEVIERSKKAQDLGADALMILPPYLEGPQDDDGLFEFYAALDSALNIDIVGYNIPQATGIGISLPLYKRLSQLPNFAYIKDSSGDLTQHQLYLQAGHKVLNGADPITLYAILAGAHGCIWGGANYMPYEAVQLWQLATTGQHAQAQALWQKMLPSLLHIWTHDYIPCVKAAARMRGFDGGDVRRPLRPLNPEQYAELQRALAPLG